MLEVPPLAGTAALVVVVGVLTYYDAAAIGDNVAVIPAVLIVLHRQGSAATPLYFLLSRARRLRARTRYDDIYLRTHVSLCARLLPDARVLDAPVLWLPMLPSAGRRPEGGDGLDGVGDQRGDDPRASGPGGRGAGMGGRGDEPQRP